MKTGIAVVKNIDNRNVEIWTEFRIYKIAITKSLLLLR